MDRRRNSSSPFLSNNDNTKNDNNDNDNDDNVGETSWLHSHRKHVLIISLAGKPVFSRHAYGDSGLAICALVRGLCAKTRDQLVAVSTPVFRMAVVIKPQLILVAISQTAEPVEYLTRQLELLHNHGTYALRLFVDIVDIVVVAAVLAF